MDGLAIPRAETEPTRDGISGEGTAAHHVALVRGARELLPGTVALRRELHRHPELGLTLPDTQATVLCALDGLGLRITTGDALSSVTAVLDSGRPGRTILLRADMDALAVDEETGLPFASATRGAMHACGHDMHTFMLVGAARLLAERREPLSGRVVFMFQPGEEGFHGARHMLAEGVLDAAAGGAAPDAAFALNVFAHLPAGTVHVRTGPMFAAQDGLIVRVTGRGGHAARPHLALDPVLIACAIVQGLQTTVTRGFDVFDPAVVTIGRITAGTTSNAIPETADLLGTIRTLSAEAANRPVRRSHASPRASPPRTGRTPKSRSAPGTRSPTTPPSSRISSKRPPARCWATNAWSRCATR